MLCSCSCNFPIAWCPVAAKLLSWWNWCRSTLSSLWLVDDFGGKCLCCSIWVPMELSFAVDAPVPSDATGSDVLIRIVEDDNVGASCRWWFKSFCSLRLHSKSLSSHFMSLCLPLSDDLLLGESDCDFLLRFHFIRRFWNQILTWKSESTIISFFLFKSWTEKNKTYLGLGLE